jgi:hypothetical protein
VVDQFPNLDEVVKRLGLDADPTDRASVIRALKARLADLHPDRTGGEFESEESRRAFLEAQAAIASVEAAEPTALVPLREVTSLVESLAKSVAPLGAVQEEILRTQRTREIRERVRAHHYSFKITSGTLLAISSGLFAFMGALKDNPVLGRLLGIPGVDLGLLVIWLCSGLLFGMSWLRERRAESYAEFLTTDEGLTHTFERLRQSGLESLPTGGRGFARQQLIEVILTRGRPDLLPLRSRRPLGRSAVEGIASVQLEKLLARGVVKRYPRKGLGEWFEVDPALLDEGQGA